MTICVLVNKDSSGYGHFGYLMVLLGIKYLIFGGYWILTMVRVLKNDYLLDMDEYGYKHWVFYIYPI